MPVLQLITRCLEVAPVYTHTRRRVSYCHRVRKETQSTPLHSCGLSHSFDSALLTTFFKDNGGKKKNNTVLTIFHIPV